MDVRLYQSCRHGSMSFESTSPVKLTVRSSGIFEAQFRKLLVAVERAASTNEAKGCRRVQAAYSSFRARAVAVAIAVPAARRDRVPQNSGSLMKTT